MSIINEINDIELLKENFDKNKRVKIDNFFSNDFLELLYKEIINEKRWILSTGIDKNRFEKVDNNQTKKINSLQIKNVQKAFSNNSFSYVFYKSMNNTKTMSFLEYKVRKYLNSFEFINKLNEITNLNLSSLNTLFLSKYISGNFLSPHSDKGNGKLAFTIQLTKNWKPQYGGNLHFLNEERNQIIETIVPDFNTLFLFYVPEENGIPHFVSHIVPNITINRYAITGWFI
jgi:Rps23 Pro-64 3,4-dihydroxylase Tpa1-like proline 4-hydroxylase